MKKKYCRTTSSSPRPVINVFVFSIGNQEVIKLNRFHGDSIFFSSSISKIGDSPEIIKDFFI